MRQRLIFWSAIVLCIAAAAVGKVPSDWPNWRGPYGNGSANANTLPTHLSPQAAAWSVALPGPAGSTPAVHDGRVYLTSTERGSDNLIALCLDAASGSMLWHKIISHCDQRYGRNTPASSSPIVDDQRLYVMFGNGELQALAHNGNTLWRRNLVEEYGPFSFLFGYGSSPLLYNDLLYVPVLRRPKVYRGPQPDKPLVSYLLAVEAATGKTVFFQERPTDAVDETTNSYITPVVAHVDGGTKIVLFGADYLTAHDPQTGHEWLRYQYDTSKNPRARNIPTPIADGSRLYAILPRGTGAVAYDLSDCDKPQRWISQGHGSDASSPALYKGRFYMIDDRTKMLVCLNASDGVVCWKGQLNQKAMYFASITAADDKLYTVNEAGVVNVVAADPTEFRLLDTADFGQGPVYSSIAVADNRLYLRTAETLYCFQRVAD
jgi:outer membrane protein assembly factor BamB